MVRRATGPGLGRRGRRPRPPGASGFSAGASPKPPPRRTAPAARPPPVRATETGRILSPIPLSTAEAPQALQSLPRGLPRTQATPSRSQKGPACPGPHVWVSGPQSLVHTGQGRGGEEGAPVRAGELGAQKGRSLQLRRRVWLGPGPGRPRARRARSLGPHMLAFCAFHRIRGHRGGVSSPRLRPGSWAAARHPVHTPLPVACLVGGRDTDTWCAGQSCLRAQSPPSSRTGLSRQGCGGL